jgi:hypothetical protein
MQWLSLWPNARQATMKSHPSQGCVRKCSCLPPAGGQPQRAPVSSSGTSTHTHTLSLSLSRSLALSRSPSLSRSLSPTLSRSPPDPVSCRVTTATPLRRSSERMHGADPYRTALRVEATHVQNRAEAVWGNVGWWQLETCTPLTIALETPQEDFILCCSYQPGSTANRAETHGSWRATIHRQGEMVSIVSVPRCSVVWNAISP